LLELIGSETIIVLSQIYSLDDAIVEDLERYRSQHFENHHELKQILNEMIMSARGHKYPLIKKSVRGRLYLLLFPPFSSNCREQQWRVW